MIKTNNQNQSNYDDIIGIVSLLIGLQNLQENREQSRQNDVQSANDKQAEYLLNEINRRFEEQNETLKQHTKILQALITKINFEE